MTQTAVMFMVLAVAGVWFTGRQAKTAMSKGKAMTLFEPKVFAALLIFAAILALFFWH